MKFLAIKRFVSGLGAGGIVVALSVTIVSFSGLSPDAEALEINLPPDTSELRESDLPGYALAQQKCGICHSANYISYQPPGMTLGQWTAEMSKMQHSYGAPIDEDEIRLIGAYLAIEYGSASVADPEVQALASLAPAVAQSEAEKSGGVDVQALLLANACTGCHAVDARLVGPAFREVAKKYADVDDAVSRVAQSIQRGGSGKWGDVPMPPMAGLSDDDAQALARYVLQR